MTISAVARNDYVGNGATATYSFTFKIFEETDLEVTVRDTSDVESVLSYPGGFSVSAGPWASGGTITLVTGSLTTGYALTIRRVRPLSQETDLQNQAAFFAEVHEDTFDQLAMVDQQQQDELDRTVKLPTTIDPADVDVTLPIPKAGKVLAWDPVTGDRLVNADATHVELTTIDDDNVVFQQSGVGAVVRSGRDKMREVITPADFGAVGDGVTNDAAALIAAIAALPSGGTLVLRGGTYLVGSALTIAASGVTIRGEAGASLKKGFNGTLLTVTGADVVVEGLTINGNTATYSGVGILLNGAARGVVRNCVVMNTRSTAIYLVGCAGARIIGNQMYGLANHGVFAESNTWDLVIQGNRIDVSSSATADSDCVQLHSVTVGAVIRDVSVVGNVLSIGASLGFCVEAGAFGGTPPTNILVAGNTMRFSAACAGGVSFGDTMSGSVISGNTIDANGQNASVAGIELVRATYCAVTGNTIIGSAGLTKAMSIDQSSHNAVQGNTVTTFKSSGFGIHCSTSTATSADRNVLTGNRITVPATGSPIGIWLQCNNAGATMDDTIVAHNSILGGSNTVGRGIVVEQDAGNMRRTLVDANNVSTVNVGIDLGGQNSRYTDNFINNCTSTYGGGATSQRRWDGNIKRFAFNDGETQLIQEASVHPGINIGFSGVEVIGASDKRHGVFRANAVQTVGVLAVQDNAAADRWWIDETGAVVLNRAAANLIKTNNGLDMRLALGGTTIITLEQATLRAVITGLRLNANNFASLGAPTDGTVLYCGDCTIAAPCAGGGGGAIAKRLAGVWVCN
jgi:hypothetical protein